jgi:hypothetical protein
MPRQSLLAYSSLLILRCERFSASLEGRPALFQRFRFPTSVILPLSRE